MAWIHQNYSKTLLYMFAIDENWLKICKTMALMRWHLRVLPLLKNYRTAPEGFTLSPLFYEEWVGLCFLVFFVQHFRLFVLEYGFAGMFINGCTPSPNPFPNTKSRKSWTKNKISQIAEFSTSEMYIATWVFNRIVWESMSSAHNVAQNLPPGIAWPYWINHYVGFPFKSDLKSTIFAKNRSSKSERQSVTHDPLVTYRTTNQSTRFNSFISELYVDFRHLYWFLTPLST